MTDTLDALWQHVYGGSRKQYHQFLEVLVRSGPVLSIGACHRAAPGPLYHCNLHVAVRTVCVGIAFYRQKFIDLCLRTTTSVNTVQIVILGTLCQSAVLLNMLRT